MNRETARKGQEAFPGQFTKRREVATVTYDGDEVKHVGNIRAGQTITFDATGTGKASAAYSQKYSQTYSYDRDKQNLGHGGIYPGQEHQPEPGKFGRAPRPVQTQALRDSMRERPQQCFLEPTMHGVSKALDSKTLFKEEVIKYHERRDVQAQELKQIAGVNHK